VRQYRALGAVLHGYGVFRVVGAEITDAALQMLEK